MQPSVPRNAGSAGTAGQLVAGFVLTPLTATALDRAEIIAGQRDGARPPLLAAMLQEKEDFPAVCLPLARGELRPGEGRWPGGKRNCGVIGRERLHPAQLGICRRRPHASRLPNSQ